MPRLTAAVREAGALARQTVRADRSSTGPRARRSPVTEADIAVNDLLRERLRARAGRRLAVGGKRGRSRRGSRAPSCLDRRSDRRHPRLSRRPRRLVAFRWRWSRTAGRCWRRSMRRSPTRSFSPSRGEGATLNGVPMQCDVGGNARCRPLAGPKRYLERLAGSVAEITAPCRKVHSLALATCPCCAGRARCRFRLGRQS